MSCRSLCNVLQCLGDETALCDFAIQLCVSTIYWTVNKYCTYEESTCIHGNSDSKTVLMLLKCFLKDMANAELISYEDIYSLDIYGRHLQKTLTFTEDI